MAPCLIRHVPGQVPNNNKKGKPKMKTPQYGSIMLCNPYPEPYGSSLFNPPVPVTYIVTACYGNRNGYRDKNIFSGFSQYGNGNRYRYRLFPSFSNSCILHPSAIRNDVMQNSEYRNAFKVYSATNECCLLQRVGYSHGDA